MIFFFASIFSKDQLIKKTVYSFKINFFILGANPFLEGFYCVWRQTLIHMLSPFVILADKSVHLLLQS